MNDWDEKAKAQSEQLAAAVCDWFTTDWHPLMKRKEGEQQTICLLNDFSMCFAKTFAKRLSGGIIYSVDGLWLNSLIKS